MLQRQAAHLEASTSGRCLQRPNGFGAQRHLRSAVTQTKHYIRLHDSAVCSATPPNAQASSQKDWSGALLAMANKRRKKSKPEGSGTPEPTKEWQNSGMVDEDDDTWGDEDFSERAPASAMIVDAKRLPAAVRCFDTARIYIKSGDGGAGCVSFRREPYVEKGGPNGGNGGRGGNVWAIAEEGINSLLPFRNQAHFRAKGGVPGQGSQMNGADGEDLYIKVPIGTIIRKKDAQEGEPALAELISAGHRALLAVGGRGGRGNLSFKTGKNTAPTLAERGEEGYEMYLDLELKVVADVGIVGVPNAGKSTLLSRLSAARPKIANYPFTTLVPNLGVCEMDFQTTVFADVPGLLEGAHEGVGLGHRFLRHVQRCRALVHVVDGTSPDPIGDYKAIQLELELFNPELRDKPQVVAYNKIDVPDSGDYWEFVQDYLTQEEGLPADRVFAISAVTGRGVTELVRGVRGLLEELGPAEVMLETDALNRTTLPKRRSEPDIRIDDFKVEADPNPLPGGTHAFLVRGQAIERFTQMTNWDYYEAVKRFERILEASGITAALRKAGIKEGDTVVLGDQGEFVWSDDRSESALYGAWLEDMSNRGRNRQGKSKWPGAKRPAGA